MLSLRSITENDLKFINDTRNDPSTRSQLENTNIISLNETITWFRSKSPAWFIIDHKGLSVGYMRTSHDTKVSICIGCDIHPNHRGKGYAKEAYQILIHKLYEQGYSILWLDLYRDNHVAYSLYKKLGFIEVGSNSRLVNNREYITMVHAKNV